MSTENPDGDLVMTPGLSLRTIEALKSNGITTLAQLNELSREQLIEIKGIGKVGAEQVRRTLGRLIDARYSTK